jgi:hypothetical protein
MKKYYNTVDACRSSLCFYGAYFLHLQGRRVSQVIKEYAVSKAKMEAAFSSETSVNFYRPLQRNIPEYASLSFLFLIS